MPFSIIFETPFSTIHRNLSRVEERRTLRALAKVGTGRPSKASKVSKAPQVSKASQASKGLQARMQVYYMDDYMMA